MQAAAKMAARQLQKMKKSAAKNNACVNMQSSIRQSNNSCKLFMER